MKKIIITALAMMLFVTLALQCNSQILYGENWTNVPANLTPEVIQTIVEKTPDTYIGVFRNDKYTLACPDAEINNVIALSNSLRSAGKQLALVYTFNTRGGTISNNFYAYQKFIDAGIFIPCVRMGNEEYFKAAGHNGNFSHYQNYFNPVITELNARGFSGIVIFPLPKPGQSLSWTDQLETVIDGNINYSGDVHFYWNEDEIPAMANLSTDVNGEKVLAPVVIASNGYAITQDNFYRDSYLSVIQSDLIERVFSDFNSRFPNKKAWVTEFGPCVGVGNLGGTLGYEATVDWFYNQMKDRTDVAAVCKFNGAGSLIGSVTKASKNDLVTTGYTKRLDHYTQALFLRNKNNSPIPSVPIYEARDYIFRYQNMLRVSVDPEALIPIADGYYLSSFEYEYISGANYYSSSGVCQWWLTGSEKTYEISGSNFSNGIPPLSYGYIHCTIKKMDIYGCTIPTALNFNPDANLDDGSCTFDVFGCMDRAATNYNQEATKDDGSCVFPAPVCMKKRWLFSGCKASKTNCNCN